MPDSYTAPITAFAYRYRDASNYKVDSSILLSGALTNSDKESIVGKLHDGEFFVAEQLGIPPLRQALFELSGGPNDDDHCWHEFVAFLDEPVVDEPIWGSANELISGFSAVGDWNVSRYERFAE